MIHDICELEKKKHEIINYLDEYKNKLLLEMSGVDKATLTRLREIIKEFDKIEQQVCARINFLENNQNSFTVESSANYEKFVKETEKLVSDFEKSIEKEFDVFTLSYNDRTAELQQKTLGYVTPQMFGAVGDGLTDDYISIVKAIKHCTETKSTLVFPKAQGYYISAGLTFNGEFDVIMETSIIYEGDGTALHIGETSKTIGNRKLVLMVTSNKTEYTANSRGIVIVNANQSDIFIRHCRGFEKNIVFIGDGGGFAYNTIRFGFIYDSLVLLTLSNANGGWCNENSFYDGRFGVFSNASYKDKIIGILLTSENNYYNNNNRFYNHSLESINKGIVIEYGQYNYIEKIRTENVVTAVTMKNKSCSNVVRIGYGNSSKNIERTGNYVSLLRDAINTDIAPFMAYNNENVGNGSYSDDSRLYSNSLCSWNLQQGKLNTNVYNCVKHNDHIHVPTGRNVGVILNSTYAKTFYCKQRLLNGDNRWLVMPLDENMQSIDEIPNGLPSNPLNKYTTNSNFYFQTGANTSGHLLFTLSDNAKYVFIGLQGVGKTFDLSSLQINSDKYTNMVSLSSNKMPNIPTCEGLNGDIVLSTLDNIIGWRYYNNTWHELSL